MILIINKPTNIIELKVKSNLTISHLSYELLVQKFKKKYIELWHFCSPLKSSNGNKTFKNKKLNWYTPELSSKRNTMLGYYNSYKHFRNRNHEQAQSAYKMYLHCKKLNSQDLKTAKKLAFENYINSASNTSKAAWNIISQETSSNSKPQDILPDLNLLNNHYIDPVNVTMGQLPSNMPNHNHF